MLTTYRFTHKTTGEVKILRARSAQDAIGRMRVLSKPANVKTDFTLAVLCEICKAETSQGRCCSEQCYKEHRRRMREYYNT